jgi:hypothetical protein
MRLLAPLIVIYIPARGEATAREYLLTQARSSTDKE